MGVRPRRQVIMNVLLAFSPFIAFAVVDRLAGPTVGLIAGAVVSAALIARDYFRPGGSAKVLEIGTVVLFAALAIYAVAAGPDWSILGVRLCVDAGLLAIVVVSIIIGQPFTLQYVRDQVAKEHWERPEFVRTNYVITAAWAAAFGILVLADIVMLYVPDISLRFGVILSILALVAAYKFTVWHPERVRSRLDR
jgi:hypothetical protein